MKNWTQGASVGVSGARLFQELVWGPSGDLDFGASAGGGGEKEDPRWTAKVKFGKDNKAKPGHKNRANEKHASEVWDKFSPTGLFLDEEFCKDTFEHSDGKPWARKVYNPKVDFAPKKLRDGEWYPTTKDKLRAYEEEPASSQI